jgi:release factor glutamine methyltransferase
MDARDAAEAVTARLRAAGCVFAEDEAALLVAEAADPRALAAMVERRTAGEPLEYVVGWAELAGLRVRVQAPVFVPRRRTELLVRLASKVAPAGGVVVDLCCGSGAVGLAVGALRPDVEVHAADVDPAAVRCARLNLPADRVYQGDLFTALPAVLRGRVDVLAVNAPYVPTDAIASMPPEARDHEARVALDGGPDGLDVHRRVAAESRPWLAAGGAVLVECGRAQAAMSSAVFEAHGYAAQVQTSDDLDATVVRAQL